MRAAALVILLLPATLALPSASPSSARDIARRKPADAQHLQSLVPRHGDHEDVDMAAAEHAEAMTSEHSDTAAPASSGEAGEHAHGSHGDEHAHGHSHAKPLLELNETQILLTHSPDPPSYWDFDHSDEGKPAVLYVHIALMTLAFFVLLPLGASLAFPARGPIEMPSLTPSRCPNSPLPQGGSLRLVHHPADRLPRHVRPRHVLWPGACTASSSASGSPAGTPDVNDRRTDLGRRSVALPAQVYNGLTPDMYKGSSHTTWGWITMVLAVALNILDVGRFLLRFTRWGNKLDAKLAGLSMSEQYEKDERSVFQLGADEDDADEAARLVSSPAELHDPAPSPTRGNSLSFSDEDTAVHSDEIDWREPAGPTSTRQKVRRYLGLAADFAERMLVLLAYVEVCTGVAVWTGACRENYLNG